MNSVEDKEKTKGELSISQRKDEGKTKGELSISQRKDKGSDDMA